MKAPVRDEAHNIGIGIQVHQVVNVMTPKRRSTNRCLSRKTCIARYFQCCRPTRIRFCRGSVYWAYLHGWSGDFLNLGSQLPASIAGVDDRAGLEQQNRGFGISADSARRRVSCTRLSASAGQHTAQPGHRYRWAVSESARCRAAARNGRQFHQRDRGLMHAAARRALGRTLPASRVLLVRPARTGPP
jgi:hypothetical protein